MLFFWKNSAMFCKLPEVINYTRDKKIKRMNTNKKKWQNTTQTKHKEVDYKNKKTKYRWNIS